METTPPDVPGSLRVFTYYGPLDTAARGKIDLGRISRHWEDILRVIASIHADAVRALDVIRMLSRDGNPTQLGEAIAHYGRIHKSLHVLRMAGEPGYRCCSTPATSTPPWSSCAPRVPRSATPPPHQYAR